LAVLSTLAAAPFATAVKSPPPKTPRALRIEIQADCPLAYRIPRTIFGTFLEDIGQSIAGGISAQLIDNGSFENYDASLATLNQRFSGRDFQRSNEIGLPLPWLPLRDDGWRYEPRWGGAANSQRYLYIMGMPGREVGIRQTLYLPIERVRRFNGSLFAQSTLPAEIEISFRRSGNPDVSLAAAAIKVSPGRTWRRQTFTLVLPSTGVAALEPVDFAIAIRGDERVSLDEVLLYPEDAVDGMEPDIIRMASGLHSPLLRFGGNFTSGYHWRDGVGPVERRPTELNQSWGQPEYNQFGTDEFMRLCQLIGAKPQICLNLGSGTPAEARGWVEYCTGNANTAGGRLRMANGHRASYAVGAWELGNELWGHFQIGWQTPQGYAARYASYLRAIQDLVTPETMVFANGADVDQPPDWNEALLTRDVPSLRFLTTHFVVGFDQRDERGEQHDEQIRSMLAIPEGVSRALQKVKAQIDSHSDTRGKVRLAFTEWLFIPSKSSALPRYDNFGGALLGAGWMNMLLRNAAFVPVADMTGLMEFAGIYKRRGRIYATPQYWAFSMYSNNAGDLPLTVTNDVETYNATHVSRVGTVNAVPWVDAVATSDSHSGDVVLFAVNRDWTRAAEATIHLEGFVPRSSVRVETLTADALTAENDEEQPERILPRVSEIGIAGAKFGYALPAASLTVMRFSPQQ
jgi:alpha-N-arabinofuranosidase